MLWDWDVSTEISSLVVFTIFTLTILCIQRWMQKSPVAHLPGPRGLPILGNSLLFANNADLNRSAIKEAEQYEGLFKLEILLYPPTICLSTPNYLKTFYTSTDLLDRSSHYRGIADISPDTFFTSNGARWKELRRLLIINFFSVTKSNWVMNFCINSKSFVEDFRRKSDGPFFPADDIIHHRALDSIALNCLGEKLEEDEARSLAQNANEVFSIAFHRIAKVKFFFNFIFNRTSEGRKFWELVHITKTACKKIVVKKWYSSLELKKKQEPLPNLYIYNALEQFGEHLENNESLEMISEELKSLAQAGQDTTTSVIGFVLTILGILPDVQRMVYEEDQIVLRHLAGREPEPKDLNQYEYLERVIKETLRLFPTVPLMGRKVNKDTFFGSYFVPKGAEVVALLTPSHLDPVIFPNPLKFDPDRFLPDNASQIPPFAYTPFSAGRRNCPGQRYAMMSLKLYLSALVREFRIYSIYTTVEEAIENSYAEFTMLDKNQWTLRLETRKLNHN